MLENGRYRARALDAALGETKDKNPQVAVRFELLDEDYAGQEITWFGSFSKNLGKGTKTPFQRTIESLRTCGWTGDDLSELVGINANEVSLVIEREEYQGETTAKVKWVNAPGGLALKAPMGAESAKAFAARMKGDVIAASRNVAVAKKPVNGGGSHPNAPGSSFGPPPREPGEDDIPY